MADYNSSLPIRTEAAGDVDVNISDAVTPSQKLVVESDGSINVNSTLTTGSEVKITDGTETVNVSTSNELQVKDDDSIALLTTIDADTGSIATDTSTIAGDTTSIDGKTPALGAAATAASTPVNIASDQTVPVSAASLPLPTGAATAANQLPDGHNVTVDNAAGGAAVNIQDGGNSITVDATDLDIRDLAAATDKVAIQDTAGDELGVNADGSINVNVTQAASDPIVDYNTSASVAKDASVNHDYTVTAAKTFSGQEMWASGSGKMKVEVLVNGSTVFVAFNSTANPNIRIPLDGVVQADALQVVRITMTNLDNQAQDLYSTLTGSEAS